MKGDCTTNSHYPVYTFLFRKVGRMHFLNLGVKGLIQSCLHSTFFSVTFFPLFSGEQDQVPRRDDYPHPEDCQDVPERVPSQAQVLLTKSHTLLRVSSHGHTGTLEELAVCSIETGFFFSLKMLPIQVCVIPANHHFLLRLASLIHDNVQRTVFRWAV